MGKGIRRPNEESYPPAYPPKNYGCSKYRTGFDKQHTDYLDNTHQTGKTGTRYFQYLMAQKNIEAEYIDYTYDIILPEHRYAVEIKTRRPEFQASGKNKNFGRDVYSFTFTVSQAQKDAFDYAVCFGIDKEFNVKDIYVIPQRYIYEKAKQLGKLRINPNTRYKNVSINVKIPVSPYPKDGPRQIHRHFDTYDNWQMCRDRLDVFEIDNKSTFTRKKNKMYHDIINYYNEQKHLLHLKIKNLWNNGLTGKQICRTLGISKGTFHTYKDELNFGKLNPNAKKAYGYKTWTKKQEKQVKEIINKKGRNKFICKKCNYTTTDKSKMLRHLNRQNPCKGKKK